MDPGGTGLAGTGLRTAFLKNAPTYGQIAYTDVSAPTSHIRIAKAADGSGDQILLTGVDPAWSPGGAKLVYRTGQGLRLQMLTVQVPFSSLQPSAAQSRL